jgi:hypothetical protein
VRRGSARRENIKNPLKDSRVRISGGVSVFIRVVKLKFWELIGQGSQYQGLEKSKFSQGSKKAQEVQEE